MPLRELNSLPNLCSGDSKDEPEKHAAYSRLRLAAVHLAVSVLVLAILAIAIFLLWYPPPFDRLSGGLRLFGLVALVDVLLGPLGTFVVSNPLKPRTEWRRDVVIIVGLQLGALFYGVWTVYQSRPVYLVFEIDRFRVVHASDVPLTLLSHASPEFQRLPLNGYRLLAVRPFRDQQERLDVTLAALQGLHIGARPDLWIDYNMAVPAVQSAAYPLLALLQKVSASERRLIQRSVAKTGIVEENLSYLPLVSRSDSWTVLLDAKTARPVGHVPIDAF